MKKIPRFIPSITIKEILAVLCTPSKEPDPLNKFCQMFEEYLKISHAIPAPSGRTALAGLIKSLSLPSKGEVILPALTFHAIPYIFQSHGLTPRFVDIDPSTYCIDPNAIEKSITSQTVAIMPVHLYGRICDMEAIMTLAKRHHLIVIEDCAQACGAKFQNHYAGTFGDGAFFSFHPHKNFCCLESGMAVTHSLEAAQKFSIFMRQFPCMGPLEKVKTLLYICNMRLITQPFIWDYFIGPFLQLCSHLGFDPIELLTNEAPQKKSQAFNPSACALPGALHGKIGMQQIEKLKKLNAKRIELGDQLWHKLKTLETIRMPDLAPSGQNIYSSFVIQSSNKQQIRKKLREYGIDTHGGNMAVGPQLPGMEQHPATPHAAQINKELIHIPLYPQMGEEHLSQIHKALLTIEKS